MNVTKDIRTEIEKYKKLLETNKIQIRPYFSKDYIELMAEIPLQCRYISHSYNEQWDPPTPIPIDIKGVVLAKKIAEKYEVEFFEGGLNPNYPVYLTKIFQPEETKQKIESLIEAKRFFSISYKELEKMREFKIEKLILQ